MRIKELTIQAFELFTQNSPLRNYMQTEEYARLMGENNYNYDYLGLVDENNVVLACSLIVIKKISFNYSYGYAPKGFLLNYYDESLVNMFVNKLKEYYSKKNIVFIKINPEIVVGEINPETYELKSNPNLDLKRKLEKFGFKKLKDNLYFESVEPRFNAYIDLKNSKREDFSKVTRNKVRNSKRKGLYLTKGSEDDLEKFYELLDANQSLNYYKSLYNLFNKKNRVDLLLVKVNYEEFIKSSQALYESEQNNNSLLNEILHRSTRKEDLNKKMASDSKLCSIKNDIIAATDGLKNNNNCLVAVALIIKYDNRVHVIKSGFDKKYASLNANYFLYDQIIEMYKKDYDYLDINGISGDFTKNSPYRGLNRFKLGFNPHIYEYIGEFDLIFNNQAYKYLLSRGKLAHEFNKKES